MWLMLMQLDMWFTAAELVAELLLPTDIALPSSLPFQNCMACSFVVLPSAMSRRLKSWAWLVWPKKGSASNGLMQRRIAMGGGSDWTLPASRNMQLTWKGEEQKETGKKETAESVFHVCG